MNTQREQPLILVVNASLDILNLFHDILDGERYDIELSNYTFEGIHTIDRLQPAKATKAKAKQTQAGMSTDPEVMKDPGYVQRIEETLTFDKNLEYSSFFHRISIDFLAPMIYSKNRQ